MKESPIQAEIFRAIGSRPDCRIFRNNQGQAWVGQLLAKHPNGSVLLAHARPLHAGLITGAGDLIGWQSIEILEHHVGMKIARFTSLEVKSQTGRISPEQLIWRNAVAKAGGIAGIVRSVAEAEELLR